MEVTGRRPWDLFDVTLLVKYTAEQGGDVFANAVRGHLRKPYAAARFVDVAGEFAEEWEAFVNGGDLVVPLSPDMFQDIVGVQLTGLYARYELADWGSARLLRGGQVVNDGTMLHIPGLRAEEQNLHRRRRPRGPDQRRADPDVPGGVMVQVQVEQEEEADHDRDPHDRPRGRPPRGRPAAPSPALSPVQDLQSGQAEAPAGHHDQDADGRVTSSAHNQRGVLVASGGPPAKGRRPPRKEVVEEVVEQVEEGISSGVGAFFNT